MGEPVRTLIAPDVRLPARRALDERLFTRWPRLYAAFVRWGSLLPPRSRVRRALLRRSVLSGWGAWARGDLELMLVRYAADFRLEAHREMMAAGMHGIDVGHAGFRELAADLREAWERVDLIPREIVDAGDVVVVLGDLHLRARGSGIELDTTIGSVVWPGSGGLVSRQRDCADWDEALQVAGISATASGGSG
jgi:ketosteroid isomerase-like protein